MKRTLFLVWQDPLKRRWYPVGRLTAENATYEFAYTHGALDAKRDASFSALASFPDLNRLYRSDRLFPLFTNRLMPASRPDYRAFLHWLNVTQASANPMVILERSGGHRVTDALEVFPCPTPSVNGEFDTVFFLHGLRHMSQAAISRAEALESGELLHLSHEPENPEDSNALALRTSDGMLLGYCPRFLAGEIRILMANGDNPPSVMVERVNPHPAPARFRVLCRLQMKWPAGFQPFCAPEYQPMVTASNPELQVA